MKNYLTYHRIIEWIWRHFEKKLTKQQWNELLLKNQKLISKPFVKIKPKNPIPIPRKYIKQIFREHENIIGPPLEPLETIINHQLEVWRNWKMSFQTCFSPKKKKKKTPFVAERVMELHIGAMMKVEKQVPKPRTKKIA